MAVPREARQAVEARFLADLARRHPGTIWHIERRTRDEQDRRAVVGPFRRKPREAA